MRNRKRDVWIHRELVDHVVSTVLMDPNQTYSNSSQNLWTNLAFRSLFKMFKSKVSRDRLVSLACGRRLLGLQLSVMDLGQMLWIITSVNQITLMSQICWWNLVVTGVFFCYKRFSQDRLDLRSFFLVEPNLNQASLEQ